MEYIDYYKILEIDKKSTQEEIKKAYRNLAKKYHPDINLGDKEADNKIKEINEAYEVLGDIDKRKKYDDLQKENQSPKDFYDKYTGYYEPKDISSNFSRNNNNNNRSDFFNIFFGGWFFDLNDFFEETYSRNSKFIYFKDGSDIEVPIEITLKEAFKGVDKKITFKTHEKIKNYTIKIPKGVKNGERIRLQGQGEAGMNGGKDGDLYLVVKFKKDNRFQIEGKDIYLDVDIYPWEAALGKDVPVSLVNGKIIVKIPAGVQTDNLIRVAKKGYVDRSGNLGDLYIKIKIVNPENISPRIKKLYERLGESLVNVEMNSGIDNEN